jgi:phage shock protein C
MTTETKRLVRSRTERMLFGVCGGIGDFLGIDPTVVRLVFLITLFTWPGPATLLAYLVLAFVMPEAPLTPGGMTVAPQDEVYTGEVIDSDSL